MKILNDYIDGIMNENRINNIAVRIGMNNRIISEIYKSKTQYVDESTLFDIASVTKIVATTTLCYIAMDKGLISVKDKVSKYFECPNDKKKLTIENLLIHTMGYGHKNLTAAGNNYDNIAEYILKIPCDIPVGSDVIYSCPGFILLGKILEKVFENRLDVLFEKYVAKPLDMRNTSFSPATNENTVNSNAEECMKGIVNDYNCQFLGGIAGNAGLFSNIVDLTKFVCMLQRKGTPLFSEEIFNLGIQNHTKGMSKSRGYGFVYADEEYQRTGDLFRNGEIGHGGYTGQSVFLNTKTGFYVILLTDATKTSGYALSLLKDIHNTIQSSI